MMISSRPVGSPSTYMKTFVKVQFCDILTTRIRLPESVTLSGPPRVKGLAAKGRQLEVKIF